MPGGADAKKNILVIDDNAGILFAVQQALEMRGYMVHTATMFSGVEAVEKDHPDLILLDIFLTGEDGRDIARKLKNHKGTSHIPIIILSAYPNPDELATEAGADDYLAKPFDLNALFKKIADHI